MFDNWIELEKAIFNCKGCRVCKTSKKIFDYGNRNADVMFIGDFPSKEDETQCIPFSGIQGQLIYKVFDGIGIKKENVYLTNVLKSVPMEMPKIEEIQTCLNYLRNQVILVKPKIIVLMGKLAIINILGKEYEHSHKQFIEKKEILYFPTNSIVELYKNENKKIDFWLDLKKIKEKCEENNYVI